MRKLHISSVKPGDRTAKPIFLDNGNVLLGVGVELTDRFIARLANLGIDTLYVEDGVTEDIVPEDVVRDETRSVAVKTIYAALTDMIDNPKVLRSASTRQLGTTMRGVFQSIVSDISGRRNVLVNLAHLHTLDGYFFHHAVNVSILCGVVGLAKGFNHNQLLDLGVGAMLFDIGMTKMPKELVYKKGPLTPDEWKIIHTHSMEGYQILKNDPDISLLSAHCALQHHERISGEGYPRRLQGSNIHEYAQIVGIADVYDALISPRSYRASYSPSDAIEYLFATGNNQFNIDLIRLFTKHIAIYPLSSTVQLNTGEIGVVCDIDPVAVNRPVIRIIQESNGLPAKSPYELDMRTHLNLTIVKIL